MRRKEFLCEREGYCEVVQRGEGIRIHPALHRRGCIRAFLGHPGERLPLAERRRDRRVRSAERPKGLPGRQRRTRRIKFLQPVRKPSQKCGEGFLFGGKRVSKEPPNFGSCDSIFGCLLYGYY